MVLLKYKTNLVVDQINKEKNYKITLANKVKLKWHLNVFYT